MLATQLPMTHAPNACYKNSLEQVRCRYLGEASMSARVHLYHTQTEQYQRAFQTFLEHTDQKTQARAWLQRYVEGLPSRRVFLDVGAGNGQVTAWLMGNFQRTLALEPSPVLREALKQACPAIEVFSDPVEEAHPTAAADLVLCSHVLYHIPPQAWCDVLGRLVSWTAPGGAAIVVLQHHHSDCMKMVRHFGGKQYDLVALADEFRSRFGHQYEVRVDTVSAQVTTPDFATAYQVGEFMLNAFPIPAAPLREDLESYLRTHFEQPGAGYRFSCDQDFLQARRR